MSAPGLKITNFHYSNMAMPASNPSDYPKLVYAEPMSKNYRVVNSPEEEMAFYNSLQTGAPVPEPVVAPVIVEPTVTLSPDNDEKETLLALAKEKGIAVDGRWKVDKIRAAMTQAQPKAE